ncbi:MAG: fibronectin type III domain-containing protein [Ignavibacteriales bacterium]|nr:MAG: fibronectin type III domain-containing protein [Ignavibacteriales bacterium]
MKLISYIKKFTQPILFLLLAITFGCVESITDTQTSTTPTIDVWSPKTNDTVKVGKNTINYQAADGPSGQGLSFYELYVNKIFVKKYTQNTDGTDPIIYLEVDSTLIHTRINYSLKVFNTIGKSKESKLQENIFVKDKVPIAPSSLLLTRINDFSVTLKWNDNSINETSFELWRRDLGNGTVVDYRKIKTLPVNTISTTDGNLSPYIDYFYKVRTINESGSSEYSNEISTSSLPGGPWNLQAEATGTNLVRLTWVDFVVNELGFQIERTDPFTNNYKVLSITGSNVTEYIDNSVTASNSYKYRIAYFTPTTQSGYSNEVSISTYYTDVLPPTNLNAFPLSGPALKLTWTDNSKNLSKGTVIERKVEPDGQFIEIGSTASDVFEFIDRTINSGKTYSYRVRQKLDNKVYTPYSAILRFP